MKTTLTLILVLVCSLAYGQLTTPTLSPMLSSTQTVGITEITIRHARPSTRGRTIFGEGGLLPYGEVWRTGANAVTKFSFSENVSVSGQPLKKGSYVILSVPGERSWQVKWYEYKTGTWTDYVDLEPVVTLTVPVKKTGRLVESLQLQLQNITLNSATIELAWEHTLLAIPLTVNDQDKIMSSISRTLAGPSSFDYFQVGLYLHESGGDLNKALEYIQKVTVSEEALFFQVSREAMILQDLGMKSKALKSAQRGLKLSREAGNNDFVRINQKIIRETQE